MKLTLKQAKKDTNRLWKYLSTHKPIADNGTKNKINAMIQLGIDPKLYENFSDCPLCKYINNREGGLDECSDDGEFKNCPIIKRYHNDCCLMGYHKYNGGASQKNAKNFYDNIKGCLK